MGGFDFLKSIVYQLDRLRAQHMTFAKEIEKGLSFVPRAEHIANSIAFVGKDKLDDLKIHTDISNHLMDIHSPLFDVARSVNRSILNTFETILSMKQTSEQVSNVFDTWIRKLGVHADSVAASEAVVRAHLARISEVTILAQASLVQQSWDEIEKGLKFNANALSDAFLNFSKSII